MKPFHSLGSRLLALVWLGTFSALAVAASIFMFYDVNSYRSERISDLNTQIELLTYASIPALQFDDTNVATENLALLRLRPTVQMAAIYTATGALFATYSRDDTQQLPLRLPEVGGVMVGSDSLQVSSRVLDNGEIVGFSYVREDYAPWERVGTFTRILAVATFAAMIVATLVALHLRHRIIRPILGVVGIARKVVVDKNYGQRAVKVSDDEAGILVDAFNDMLGEIQRSTMALETTNAELEREIDVRTRAQEQVQRLNEELEDKVLERTRQLEISNQELESFCYSVSHDLRAPLRSISGFSRALQEELTTDLSADALRYLDRIAAATTRMGQLIEDLLNLSRISRYEPHLVEVNLSALATQVLEDLRHREPARDVQFSLWSGMTAVADPKLLRILLENLLSNAWKFTSQVEQARIDMGVMKDDGNEVYFIRDNGAGFDMTYADKLFTPFQRLHGVHEFPGTGIGLVTVQRIVHRHGGRVWCDARPGQGAIFYFTLRHAPASASAMMMAEVTRNG